MNTILREVAAEIAVASVEHGVRRLFQSSTTPPRFNPSSDALHLSSMAIGEDRAKQGWLKGGALDESWKAVLAKCIKHYMPISSEIRTFALNYIGCMGWQGEYTPVLAHPEESPGCVVAANRLMLSKQLLRIEPSAPGSASIKFGLVRGQTGLSTYGQASVVFASALGAHSVRVPKEMVTAFYEAARSPVLDRGWPTWVEYRINTKTLSPKETQAN